MRQAPDSAQLLGDRHIVCRLTPRVQRSDGLIDVRVRRLVEVFGADLFDHDRDRIARESSMAPSTDSSASKLCGGTREPPAVTTVADGPEPRRRRDMSGRGCRTVITLRMNARAWGALGPDLVDYPPNSWKILCTERGQVSPHPRGRGCGQRQTGHGGRDGPGAQPRAHPDIRLCHRRRGGATVSSSSRPPRSDGTRPPHAGALPPRGSRGS